MQIEQPISSRTITNDLNIVSCASWLHRVTHSWPSTFPHLWRPRVTINKLTATLHGMHLSSSSKQLTHTAGRPAGNFWFCSAKTGRSTSFQWPTLLACVQRTNHALAQKMAVYNPLHSLQLSLFQQLFVVSFITTAGSLNARLRSWLVWTQNRRMFRRYIWSSGAHNKSVTSYIWHLDGYTSLKWQIFRSKDTKSTFLGQIYQTVKRGSTIWLFSVCLEHSLCYMIPSTAAARRYNTLPSVTTQTSVHVIANFSSASWTFTDKSTFFGRRVSKSIDRNDKLVLWIQTSWLVWQLARSFSQGLVVVEITQYRL